LGLAMVYGFVRQSGGHITLYSEPGLGTSFGLYFPALPEVSEADAVTPGGAATTEAPDIGKGRTVLVVEDNPRVRKLSLARLAGLGFETAEASNGDAAYAMLNDGLKIDVLFSDLVMPGKLNGYDLAAKVAEHHPGVKVLLTSGYASDVISERMARGTHYEILHKPFRQSELVLRLQALLDDGSEGRRASTSPANM
ncbi:MAG: response regulator, partial [Pseudomonadota bacterium]